MSGEEEVRASSWQRIGWWLLIACFALLCGGYVAWVMLSGGSGSSERWMAERREKGERFTIAELFPEGFGDPATNRTAELYALIDALQERPGQFHGNSLREMGDGVAEPYWRKAVPEGAGFKGSNSWANLQTAVDAESEALQHLYRLLANPDRDLGDSLHAESKAKTDYVRIRSLGLHLVGVVNTELNRGDYQAAADALSGLMDLPRWHERHNHLVNGMIAVALSNLGVDVQWTALQRDGWSSEQLVEWQKRWQDRVMLPRVVQSAQVERAIILEYFDLISTNRFRVERVYGRPSNHWENAHEWFRRNFIHDRDKLYSLRFHQTVIDSGRAGLRERSRAAYKREYAAMGKLEAELQRGLGKSCTITHALMYSGGRAMDTVFRYETRREMLVTEIALRRFHEANGEFPEKLSGLVPKFLGTEPVDWMNGGKLIYHRSTNGWFHLRSSGLNGKDELGAGDDLPWWQTPEQRH